MFWLKMTTKICDIVPPRSECDAFTKAKKIKIKKSRGEVSKTASFDERRTCYVDVDVDAVRWLPECKKRLRRDVSSDTVSNEPSQQPVMKRVTFWSYRYVVTLTSYSAKCHRSTCRYDVSTPQR